MGYMFIEYTRLPEMYPILQPLELGKVFILVTAVGWLASGRQSNQQSASRSMDRAILALLAGCLASALFAQDRSIAFSGFLDVVRWAVVYFLISRIVTSSWRLRLFVLVLLLLCLKLSQFEIRDYVSQMAFGRSGMFLSTRGVGAGSTGFFGNGGDFGVAMCVVWPLAGSLLFGESKKLTRFFLLGCFGAFLVSIFLCGARAAVVGAAAIAFFSWAKQPKRIFGVLTVLILLVGIFYVLPEGTKERFDPVLHLQRDETSQMRLDLWSGGMHMFEANPILGVGVNNFGPTFLSEYGGETSASDAFAVYAPHSIYVQALSETGLAGTLPLVALWVLFVRTNRRTRERLKMLGLANRKSFEYRLSIGLDLAFVGYMVSGAFYTVLLYPHLWYLLGLCAGLHVTCLKKQPEAVGVEAEAEKRKPGLALAAS